MSAIKKLIRALDSFQQRHAWFGFTYAIIKKYGDDQASYQAALLTYYGFLSLFPLLLVLTTVLGITAGHHSGVQATITNSITSYFPQLGSQLSAHIHSLHKNGSALIIGIVLTFYGARGVADVFRYGVNHVWQVPGTERDGFPKSTIKSLAIVIVGGLGFMVASLTAGYAGAVGQGIAFRMLSLVVNVFILFWLFNFLLNVSLPYHVKLSKTWAGAATAAIGLVVLQSVGSYLLTRELKNLDTLYSTFAIALGLLYWLYLQAQVLYYAVEIDVVRSKHLWPRALDASRPTKADELVYTNLAKKEKKLTTETVSADFSD
jgi:YihY family inner membrane protein